jgi:hypothetical protein
VVSFKSPADTPAMPGMLRKSAAFAPRYRKFESISLQQRVCEPSVPLCGSGCDFVMCGLKKASANPISLSRGRELRRRIGSRRERTDDQCSVDLHGELANPVNEIRAQIFRSFHDLDLEVAPQDLFPQDA